MLRDYGYVFVITYGRSGSTVLMKLLNTQDGFEIRGENHNALFHVFLAAMAASTTRQTKGNKTRDGDSPWFGASRVKDGAFRDRLLEGFVADILSPSAGTKVTGFKEIRHTPHYMTDVEFAEYVAFLTSEFPNAKVILNTRDAASVAKSGWFAKQDPATVIEMIEATNTRFRKAAAGHPSCFLIDYDDVVGNGERLQELFKFLGSAMPRSRIADIVAKPLTHMKRRKSRGFFRDLLQDMPKAAAQTPLAKGAASMETHPHNDSGRSDMLEISPGKIAHIAVLAREFDANMGSGRGTGGDATESELRAFVEGLNSDEQASLVAVMWIGRETFAADELTEAIQTAKAEATAPTADYLIGVPLLSDYLESGLEELGFDPSDLEDDIYSHGKD